MVWFFGGIIVFDDKIQRDQRGMLYNILENSIIDESIISFRHTGAVLYPFKIILESNDIILPEIGANLGFDEYNIDFAWVTQAMCFSHRDVS